MPTPEPTPSPSPESGGASIEDARAVIRAVISWSAGQMMTARRAVDQQRLAELTEQQQACGRDLERLNDAEPGEVARITEVYTERLKVLQADENN